MTNALEALLEESISKGIAQGIEQGREIGIELGRAAGRAEGERALLRRLLTQRFGAIPTALDRRIEQADAEAVTALFDRALTIERIDLL